MKYKLVDAINRNVEYSDTFSIPDNTDIQEIKIGSIVKIGLTEGEGDNEITERMWIIVTKIFDDGNYEGTLDNDPSVLKSIKFKDVIKFSNRNILDIWGS